MEAIEIKGKINTALCYAKVVEDEAIEQVRLCVNPLKSMAENVPRDRMLIQS